MRVAFITREGWTNPDTGEWIAGGTSHLRAIIPARALDRHAGIHTSVAHIFGQNKQTGEIYPYHRQPDGALQPGAAPDIIVFVRWMNAAGTQADGTGDDIATVQAKAQAAGQLCVQDVDDWIWHIPTSNVGYWATHPKHNPQENRTHYKKAVARADLVTCSTPYLAERISRWTRQPPAVLRNMIDLDAYTEVRARNRDRLETAGPARTIGWTGSTIYRGGDLETLRGTLSPHMARHGQIFVHGGDSPNCPPAGRALGLRHVATHRRREQPPDLYPRLFDGLDLFIAPLADHPFNQAKSACKIQEAAAAGVPYIASAVGPYLEWAGGGAVARRPKDWLRHLARLNDPAERRAQAARQLELVRLEDMAVRWSDWADCYRHALKQAA